MGHGLPFSPTGHVRFRGLGTNKKRRLFAARDRFGIKPFHYTKTSTGELYFSSEIKALLPFLDKRDVDPLILGWFIAWAMSEFHTERTFLRDVRKLPPAHYLLWEEGKPLEIRRYWAFTVEPRFDVSPTERMRDNETFRRAFLEAVDLHLRSDVPVGTCLSGGLDSSSIVCVTEKLLRERGQWKGDWQQQLQCVLRRTGDRRTPLDRSGDREKRRRRSIILFRPRTPA